MVRAGAGGHKHAQECLTVYQDRLTHSLSVVINILDPDVIVLGGGLFQHLAIVHGAFRSCWDLHFF
jgi:predicted NBD/HSP70 family sugar kinase